MSERKMDVWARKSTCFIKAAADLNNKKIKLSIHRQKIDDIIYCIFPF